MIGNRSPLIPIDRVGNTTRSQPPDKPGGEARTGEGRGCQRPPQRPREAHRGHRRGPCGEGRGEAERPGKAPILQIVIKMRGESDIQNHKTAKK